MNPDVAAAVERLRDRRVLSEAQAASFLRTARRELVSIHAELRTLLYVGVLLATAGVGLFLKENHERLGPALIACLLGAGSALCLLYVFRRSSAFSWQSIPSPHIAVDYVLLLGVLLLASDLAYVETHFQLLGPDWPYHLLLVAAVYLVAAYRFDSRAVLSLALTSFAAWHGVAIALPISSRTGATAPVLRANAIACGILFVVGGILSTRWRRKAHFEAVWVTMGLLLCLGGVLSGVLQETRSNWLLWEALLAALTIPLLAIAYRSRRTLDFAIGLAALYIGVVRLLAEGFDDKPLYLLVAGTSLAAIAFLIAATRRMKGSQ